MAQQKGWSITTRGFRELTATFKNAPRAIQEIRKEWTFDVSSDEAILIRQEAPKRTGLFASLIQPYSRGLDAGIRFLPYPKLGTKLAKWIIKGTRAHWIVAKRKGALHFVWKGKARFFARVHHPGTRANDFVKRGAARFDEFVPEWLAILNDRIIEALTVKTGKRK